MRISSVRIQNFRCFEDESIALRDFTVLVGRNSAGKSTVLRALQHFYDPGLQVDAHDFHGGYEPGDEIEIAVTFADLTAKEVEAFGRYDLRPEEVRRNVEAVLATARSGS